MDESKREKFVRLAENRVNRTLNELKLITNLSNKCNYDYSQDDVDKIVKSLKKAVSDLEQKFASKNKDNFKL
jgi:hypothetical protein